MIPYLWVLALKSCELEPKTLAVIVMNDVMLPAVTFSNDIFLKLKHLWNGPAFWLHGLILCFVLCAGLPSSGWNLYFRVMKDNWMSTTHFLQQILLVYLSVPGFALKHQQTNQQTNKTNRVPEMEGWSSHRLNTSIHIPRLFDWFLLSGSSAS